jgi:ferritin
MMNERVQAALNTQINMEMRAWYTYLSMAAYFEAESLNGFAAWLRHHSDEEMVHAMKIYNFINQRRGRVMFDALPAPRNHWDSPIEAFENALEHEKKVTASIDDLMELARAEKDHATESFLKWFVDEQVEEEEMVDLAIQKLKRIGDFGPGLYLLDREMAEGVAGERGEKDAADSV